VTAVAAAVVSGIAIAPLARRLAPVGSIDLGPTLKLPRLGRSKVMLYSRVDDPRRRAALRTLSAVFRSRATI
jgi:DNA-binding transcriptional LysR family regulator